MYSASIIGTHHIFFPPRFEVVAGEEASGGIAAHLGNDGATNSLFGDEADGPLRTTFRRRSADHRRERGLFFRAEELRRVRTRLVFEAGFQPEVHSPPSHAPDLSRVRPDRRGDRLQRPSLAEQLQYSQSPPATLWELLALLRCDPAPVVYTQIQSGKSLSCHDNGRSERPIDRKPQADQSDGATALAARGRRQASFPER
jgi:hypothetical protein